MYDYDIKIYTDSDNKRVSVVKIINEQGFIGYDVDLLDEGCKQLYNITKSELDKLLE